ncbi:protein of unknown function (DUF2717) [Aeromonas phage JELG-KS1]|uniref:Uncharacterized protein n=1 Tax=Aeromonas phage JELG-KS1 TaxID=2951233 RepID=A0A9E7NLL6_9CAUD|nr:protein of unknown function (DUF2717) [Aeromonas phage JELG-KS1]
MIDPDYDVPHISKQLADYLKEELSADRQITLGFLRDDGIKRSEGYLLGFLAGLGYGRQVIDVMIANQEAAAEESDTVFRDMLDESLEQFNITDR